MPGFKELNLDQFFGLNLTEYPNELVPFYMNEALNGMTGANEREWLVRPGWTRTNSVISGLPLNKAFYGGFTVRISGTKYLLVSLNDSGTRKMFRITTGGVATQVGANGYSFTDALQYSNKAYLFTGGNGANFASWDGTTLADISPPVGLTYGIIHRDRCFAFGDASSRLYYSDAGNLASWGGSNFNDISFGDGDTLSGLYSFPDKLMIFKNKAIYVLYVSGTPAEWILRNLTMEYGGFHNSLAVINNYVYFVNQDGVYRTDGTTFQKISGPLESNYFPKVMTISSVSGARWGNFYICYAGGNEYLVYDTLHNVWATWSYPFLLHLIEDKIDWAPDVSGLNAATGDLIGISQTAAGTPASDPLIGILKQNRNATFSTYLDFGQAYDFSLKFKSNFLGDSARFKRFVELYIDVMGVGNSIFRTHFNVDDTLSAASPNMNLVDNKINTIRYPIHKVGREFAVHVQTASNSSALTVSPGRNYGFRDFKIHYQDFILSPTKGY